MVLAGIAQLPEVWTVARLVFGDLHVQEVKDWRLATFQQVFISHNSIPPLVYLLPQTPN